MVIASECSKMAEKDFVQHNVEQESAQTTCLSEERWYYTFASNKRFFSFLSLSFSLSLSLSLSLSALGLSLALAFPSNPFPALPLDCHLASPLVLFLYLMVICVI